MVTWPQPWWPLHAPKLLWKWLKQATQFPICHNHGRPKWADICRSVLFEKRMLHLWLVALCVHVVMWPSIRPSSRPRCTCSVQLARFPLWKGSSLGDVALGFVVSGGEFHVCGWLSVFVSHRLWQMWSLNPFIFSQEWRRCCTMLPVHLQQSVKHHRSRF